MCIRDRLYHVATGLELKKTYADGSCVSKTYDGLNRLETLTKARGIVTSYCLLYTSVWAAGDSDPKVYDYVRQCTLSSTAKPVDGE